MDGYLGEMPVDAKDTEFKDYTQKDWIAYWVEKYGWIDGGHHKSWLVDQIMRIVLGTSVVINKARWSNGTEEFRIRLGAPSPAYEEWVATMKDGEDGPDTYDYDIGVAP